MIKKPDLPELASKHRLPLFLLGVFVFTIFMIPLSFQFLHRNDPEIIGVSFSIKYTEELGLDWQETFTALADDIGVKHMRLMSYWDRAEPEPGQLELENLDWQIEQAEKYGIGVTLAVGQRQPRWPECHIPAWAHELDEESKNVALVAYTKTLVERYGDSPAIKSYQVENEAANRLFGECPDYNPDLLIAQMDVIREGDPDALIVTNVSNQIGTPLIGPVNKADKVGFSIYRNAHFDAFGRTNGWSYWYVPTYWHSWRASLVEGINGKQPFVHELQAEPWGPEATVNLSIDEQNKTMDARQLKNIVEYTKRTGMKEMYLWGGEWWYWRLTEFNDTELWETVREIYN